MPATPVPGSGPSRPALTIFPSCSATHSSIPSSEARAAQDCRGIAVRDGAAKDFVLHGAHGPDVRLFGHSSQVHAVGQVHVHTQRTGRPDHHGLGLFRLESVPEQRLMESGRRDVAACLPLRPVRWQGPSRKNPCGFGHPVRNRCRTGSVQALGRSQNPGRRRRSPGATAPAVRRRPRWGSPRPSCNCWSYAVRSSEIVIGL